MNLSWLNRWSSRILLVIAILLTSFFIIYSARLTKELGIQEEERMHLWASATHELIDPNESREYFPLEVIEKNSNIPVILTDSEGNLIFSRNLDEDTSGIALTNHVMRLIENGKRIDLDFNGQGLQHIYYEDSTLLRRLKIFPWIELSIIFAFLILVILAIRATQKMQQNRLWMGLTKETAHQLGTPISSLQGWIDYLLASQEGNEIFNEMRKDIERLATVTARFSKVGSQPPLFTINVTDLLKETVEYMKRRVSGKVNLHLKTAESLYVDASEPLLQWVFENIIKNAVDAMKGEGTVDINAYADNENIIILFHDTGPGIPRNRWKKIFQSGFSTKTKGWGLGLTLSKRIIEQYHFGRIEVIESSSSKGATFMIVLQRVQPMNN